MIIFINGELFAVEFYFTHVNYISAMAKTFYPFKQKLYKFKSLCCNQQKIWGKSFLLFNLFADFLKNEGVDDKHIIQINLEDRRNKHLRNPDELLAYIDARISDEKMYYVLLDEVQTVNDFEDVLNSYLNIKNVDVYVTGSNAKFLSKDVITEFRGRGCEIHIQPLSFKEFYSIN